MGSLGATGGSGGTGASHMNRATSIVSHTLYAKLIPLEPLIIFSASRKEITNRGGGRKKKEKGRRLIKEVEL